MSFVALPQEFDSTSGLCRSYAIAKQEDGDLQPIGFFRGDKTIPVDLRKLAENFATMLNGKNPVYHLGEDHLMFYEQHPSGFNFRFRSSKEFGVSEMGALFTLLPGFTMRFDDES